MPDLRVVGRDGSLVEMPFLPVEDGFLSSLFFSASIEEGLLLLITACDDGDEAINL